MIRHKHIHVYNYTIYSNITHNSCTFSTLPPIRDFVISPNLYPEPFCFLPPLSPSSLLALRTKQQYLLLSILLLASKNNDGSDDGRWSSSWFDGNSIAEFIICSWNFFAVMSRYENADKVLIFISRMVIGKRSGRRRCCWTTIFATKLLAWGCC